MTDATMNPYSEHSDEYLIWEALVKNDFEGFLSNSWEMVAKDYIEEGFFGIDFGKSDDTQNWTLNFPSLESYKDQWILDADDFQDIKFAESPRKAMYTLCRLEQLQITGNTAMIHKVFDGQIAVEGAEPLELKWRSLFLMRKVEKQWLIAGFCGYIKEK